MEEEGEDEVVRDVFGDSDEDEPAPYRAPDEIDEDLRVRLKTHFPCLPSILGKM
jgi:hypothetical protein